MSSKLTLPAAVAAITLFSLAVGAEVLFGNKPDVVYFVIAGAIAIAATTVVFGPLRARVVADPERGRKTAGLLAGASVVTLPVFWLGLPAVLGAGAVVTGRDTRLVPAIAVGAIACLLGLGASLFA